MIDGNLSFNESLCSTSDSNSSLTWNLYIQLVAACFSIIANILSVGILLDSRLKDTIYKYMLANSITNIIYLSISLPAIFFFFCFECPPSHTYLGAIFSIWLVSFFFNSLKLMHVLIEIAIGMHIYLMLINKRLDMVSYKLVLFVLVVISLAVFIPLPLSYQIVQQCDIYLIQYNVFGYSLAGFIIVVTQFGIRAICAVVILGIVNILNLIEFRKRFKIGLILHQSNQKDTIGKYCLFIKYNN